MTSDLIHNPLLGIVQRLPRSSKVVSFPLRCIKFGRNPILLFFFFFFLFCIGLFLPEDERTSLCFIF